MTERYVLASEVKELRDAMFSSWVRNKLDALLASAVELPGAGRRWRVVCQSCGASEEGSGDEVPLRLHGRMENGNWQHYVANAFTAHEWCGPVVSADALPAEHGRIWNIIKAWDIERPRQDIDNLCERIDAALPAEDGLREAFVAGAVWARGEHGAADEREAERRYPDAALAKRHRCRGCGELVESSPLYYTGLEWQHQKMSGEWCGPVEEET